MKITVHAFLTWLVAHAIHPFVWMIALVFISGMDGLAGMGLVTVICVIAFLFSIPAIFFFLLVNKLIINASLFPSEKFFLWLVSASLITATNAFLFVMLLSATDDPYISNKVTNLFILPSIVATALSVAVRYQQFLKLNKEIIEAKQSL
jgi:hypothetical protein